MRKDYIKYGFMKINGVRVPNPCKGMNFISSTFVNSGRNANGVVVSQIVGRNNYKYNNLEWRMVPEEIAQPLINELEKFHLTIEALNLATNKFETIEMYAGDRTYEPMWFNEDGTVKMYRTIKCNIVDKGEVK